ncbi:MAG TPA: hypothetical protein VMV24_00300 [Candidatus Dormibacteraeota bacterium]|nr:hypothetical protein [Candidatus Dormibacteraeota bacterium]
MSPESTPGESSAEGSSLNRELRLDNGDEHNQPDLTPETQITPQQSIMDTVRDVREREKSRTNERHRDFAEIASEFAQKATTIEVTSGIDEETRAPFTNISFILESNDIPRDDDEFIVDLGLPATEASVHIFDEGGMYRIACPVSIGVMEEIMKSAGDDLNPRLRAAINEAVGKSFQESDQKTHKLFQEIHQQIIDSRKNR